MDVHPYHSCPCAEATGKMQLYAITFANDIAPNLLQAQKDDDYYDDDDDDYYYYYYYCFFLFFFMREGTPCQTRSNSLDALDNINPPRPLASWCADALTTQQTLPSSHTSNTSFTLPLPPPTGPARSFPNFL